MKNLLICGLLALGCTVFAATFRMEAEDFDQEGKWIKGKHSILHSNEYVIVADNKNSVVKGKYEIPAAGKYYVFVRTMTMGTNWRKGTLFVNGKQLGMFGDCKITEGIKKGAWYWEKLGPVDLPKAEVEFKVTTPKGYVRIDAFVITDDAKFVPPDKPAEIGKIKALDICI